MAGLSAFTPAASRVITGILTGCGSNSLDDLVDRWLGPVPKP
jgi:hypothetical protein